MNEITFYNNSEFGTLRQLSIENEPWFVGKDVAEALGYENTRDALKRHVDDEDKGASQIATPSGTQTMTIVNESGIYSLIFNSKLPKARKFKRWVTSEVLPSIRRTGCYMPSHNAIQLPAKDYNYWVNLPEDSEDYQKLLEQERARIGAQEARKRARAQAQWEYKEYHANSPILVGSSSEGYALTDEAVEYISDYLKDQDRIKILFLFRQTVRVERMPTEVEVKAIQNYLVESGVWEPLPCGMVDSVRDRLQVWQRINFLEID